MILARVIGTVVATRKDEGARRHQACSSSSPCAPTAAPSGKPLVALDSVGAGVGEEVFYVRGREAALPFLPAEVPTDAAIVGIVDHWNLAEPRACSRARGRQRGRDPEEREARGRQAAARAAARPRREPRGRGVLAIDAVDAGVGDRVLLVQDGKAAQQVLGRGLAAVDAAVVGVVDAVELG